MLLRCLPSSFGSIQLTVWEEMLFEDFQDGPHGDCLGYRYSTSFAKVISFALHDKKFCSLAWDERGFSAGFAQSVKNGTRGYVIVVQNVLLART